MARPLPPVHLNLSESDKLEVSSSKSEALIFGITRPYEAGDAVDAIIDSCWWEGHVTAVSEQNVKVSFKTPPEGEGGVLSVNLNDLRPTMVWNDGKWTPPASQSSSKRQIGLFEDARGHIILDDDSQQLDHLEAEDQLEKETASAAANPTPSLTDDNPISDLTDHNPLPSRTDDNPFSSRTDDNPVSSRTDDNPFPSLTDEDIRQGFETLLGYVPRATHPGVQQLGLRGFFKQKVDEMHARELFPGVPESDQVLDAHIGEKIGEDSERFEGRIAGAEEQERGAANQPARSKSKESAPLEPQNRDGKYADPKKVTVTSARKARRVVRKLLERWEEASLAEIATAFESINGFTLSGPEGETEATAKSRYEKQFMRMQETGQRVKWTYRTDTRRGRTAGRWVLRLRPWPEERAGKARERGSEGVRKGGAHAKGVEALAPAGKVRERHSGDVPEGGTRAKGLDARRAAGHEGERDSGGEVRDERARAVSLDARTSASKVRAERESSEEVRNESARAAGPGKHADAREVPTEPDSGGVRNGRTRAAGRPRVTSRAEAALVIRPILERWESASAAEAARAFFALTGWRPRWRNDGVTAKAWYGERIRKMERLGKRYVRKKAKRKEENSRRGAFEYRFRLWPDDWASRKATYGTKKEKASGSARAAAGSGTPLPAVVIAKKKRTRFGEPLEAGSGVATAVERTEVNARLDESEGFARQKRRFPVTEEERLWDAKGDGAAESNALGQSKFLKRQEPKLRIFRHGAPEAGDSQPARDLFQNQQAKSARGSSDGVAKTESRIEETGARRQVSQDTTAVENLDSEGLNEEVFLHFCFHAKGRGETDGDSEGPVVQASQSAGLRGLERNPTQKKNQTPVRGRSPVLVPAVGGSKILQQSGPKTLFRPDTEVGAAVEPPRQSAGGARAPKKATEFVPRRGEPSARAQADARVHGAEAAINRMRIALRGMAKASTAYLRQVFRCVTGWVPAEKALEESGWKVKDWYKTSFEEMVAAEEVMVRERDASVPGGFRFRLEAWPEKDGADGVGEAERNRNGGEKRKRTQENNQARKAGRFEGLPGRKDLIGSTGHAAKEVNVPVETAGRELTSIDSNRLEGARVLAELRVQKRKSAESWDGDLRLKRRRTMAEQSGGSPQVRAATPLVCLSD